MVVAAAGLALVMCSGTERGEQEPYPARDVRAADLVFVGVVQSIEHLTARRAGNGILRASLVSAFAPAIHSRRPIHE